MFQSSSKPFVLEAAASLFARFGALFHRGSHPVGQEKRVEVAELRKQRTSVVTKCKHQKSEYAVQLLC